MPALTERDRFFACMEYQPVDYTPFWNWGAWPETYERWRREGYDPQKFEPAAIADNRIWIGDWFFPNPPFSHEVVEEDERSVLFINPEGILMRELKDHPDSSMPQFIKFPVENRAEFRRFWKERMGTDLSVRVGPDWKEKLITWRAQPVPFGICADRWGGFFGPLRNLLGVETLCKYFYDDPAFLEEMMEAVAEYIIAIMGQVLSVVPIDAFIFWEDMAYKTAPLISPTMARRYMLPRYRKVVDFLRSHQVPYIGLDSDGHMDSLIPVWMDAGLNFLYPFEVQAGMDVNEVRKKYGKELRLWGGVDKRVLASGPAAIDEELERVRDLIHAGGYIPHTDHSCPPDISFQNYCYYMKKLAEVCGKS